MIEEFIEEITIKEMKERAEELGISLQEYMLLKLLDKLDNLSVITYPGEN